MKIIISLSFKGVITPQNKKCYAEILVDELEHFINIYPDIFDDLSCPGVSAEIDDFKIEE
jgi:hypothetical protein